MGDHHDHEDVSAEGAFLDPEVLDRELSMPDLTRRKFLRAMGLIGAATGASRVIGLGGGAPAASALTIGGLPVTINTERYRWLAGDHHTHTQYSSDGQYTVSQQVAHASQYGLQWMVITDHGRVAHEKVGIDKTRPGILQARADFPAMLVYQGLGGTSPGPSTGRCSWPPPMPRSPFCTSSSGCSTVSWSSAQRRRPPRRNPLPSTVSDTSRPRSGQDARPRRCSWPIIPLVGASMPRTRSGTGSTPTPPSPSVWRVPPAIRLQASLPLPWDRVRLVASTTTPPRPTPTPGTRPSPTGPSVASTG